ncbi:MAG: nucleoside deaminase, partial [Actinobacteria bacterium]|nr:nucleoside deaminase [Actinomycetota bacterium]
MDDIEMMRVALTAARGALDSGDVPVGAAIFDKSGELISVAHNERELHNDPTAHAEIVALRRASQKLGTWKLENLTLVVTLEPCAMCAGAIAQSRIQTVVFGAWDEKAGAVGSVWDLLRDPR